MQFGLNLECKNSSVADLGWVKSQDPDLGSGSEIRIRDEQPGSYFRERRNNFLG